MHKFYLPFLMTCHVLLTPLSVNANEVQMIPTLQELVLAEPTSDQNNFVEKSNLLNKWQTTILASNDPELISLFQRAVRNFNSFSTIQANPVTTYYKHYQEPAFAIPQINLTFDVQDTYVKVTTKLAIVRKNDSTTLILDGRDHKVQQVSVNGNVIPRSDYNVTFHELILTNIPNDETFMVEIISQIDPFNNHSKEGMYVSNGWLTTQCESEWARRIFFTLDRPDVLSQITTTIIADSKLYPYRLSNGNAIGEFIQHDGRSAITWEDPFPKPSYLFACVLGDFSKLSDKFTTRSGMAVDLEVYVQKGKESRAVYSLHALKKIYGVR